jgi:hypothetical protein
LNTWKFKIFVLEISFDFKNLLLLLLLFAYAWSKLCIVSPQIRWAYSTSQFCLRLVLVSMSCKLVLALVLLIDMVSAVPPGSTVALSGSNLKQESWVPALGSLSHLDSCRRLKDGSDALGTLQCSLILALHHSGLRYYNPPWFLEAIPA